MKRSVGYGLVLAMMVSLVGYLGIAQVYSVYNPVANKNVPIDKVSIEEITAWLSSPEFQRWTNIEGLRQYLAKKGISLDSLMEKSRSMGKRELLAITGRSVSYKSFQPLSLKEDERVVSDVRCDLDSKKLRFTLTNKGEYPWFLVSQGLTEDGSGSVEKYLSEALIEAKPIKIFINQFLANKDSPTYWMGEKLFYPEGESFADACHADFLRQGKSVKCKLQPIPVRSGFVPNTYLVITPTIRERGTFTCE